MKTSSMIERVKNGNFTLLAEIGVNYYDIAKKMNITPMEAAKFMVLAAKNAGIHGVKFQTYKAETLAAKNSPAYWDKNEEPTQSQYELFKKFDAFGEKEYEDLAKFSEKIGIEFCSTPFDFHSADYLEPWMNIYKISSSDLTNLPFIEYIAQKGKPILLSTGASELDEIQRAVCTIRNINNAELVLLHCVLEYPTPYAHANLAKIASLKEAFPNIFIGYSDHTKPDPSYDIIKSAYLLGATLIEKHFTLDKKLTGNDHYHAMDEGDAKNILRAISFVDEINGSGEITSLATEAPARKHARRSIIAARDIPKGTPLTRDMLTFKRPGTGISPSRIEEILGKCSKERIEADTILEINMLE